MLKLRMRSWGITAASLSKTDTIRGMPDPSSWTDPAWRAPFEAWVDDALGAAGERRRGSFEQVHLRPWSTVLRLETDAGVRFAKAGAANQRHEPALLRILAELDPSLLPTLLGAHDARGWSITADGGRQARAIPERQDVLDLFATVLPRYAELQRASAAHVDALLAAGVPDARSPALVATLAEALEHRDWFEGSFEGALAPADTDELVRRLPQLARLTSKLDAGPVPSTIQHDDLHDANVFIGEGARILDWGDALVSHPFGSLLVAGIAFENRFDLYPDAPEIRRLWDAYLEPWESFASRPELHALAMRAVELDAASRALSWMRIMALVPHSELGPERAPAAWLDELLTTLRRLDSEG